MASRCPKLEVKKFDPFKKIDFDSTDMIVIHVGVNDIDKKNGRDVFEEIKHIITHIKSLAPSVKLVVSEITPRNDNRDPEVKICNTLLKSLLEKDITLAYHQNLRNNEWSFYDDVKHLSKVSIAKFASNLKQAFRRAFGIDRSTNKQRYLHKNNEYYDNQNHMSTDTHSNNHSLESFKADPLSKLTSFLGK